MKVVLFTLNASWSHSCLALRCLREPLEREGFSVTVMEHTLKDRTAHVLEHLVEKKADVYSFSCYIWNLPQMLSLSRALHELLPACRIVLGGPEVSYATGRFEGMDWIDTVICGEGEDALPAVCRCVERGEIPARILQGGRPDVMNNEGILYRNGEQTGGVLYYESSRGCPYSCGYCLSSATAGVRMKSAEQTLEDLRSFETLQTDCRIIKFVDRTFNANPARANRIWQGLLDAAYTKHYHFEVCASLLNEESFEILKQFPKGKIQLEFGLQSTNPETLEEVSRHIDPDAVIAAVRRVHEMGNIHVHLDLIAGLPYESYRRFARSFDQAYGCCDLLQLGFLKLLYGTKLRENEEKYGYVSLPDPPYTVLKSKWITYEEMCRLTRIAEVLERYDESGKFAHTKDYFIHLADSPFAFWEGLTSYLSEQDPRPLQKISQPDAYRYLLEYVKKAVPRAEETRLKELLAMDFSANEHKNPPYFLR